MAGGEPTRKIVGLSALVAVLAAVLVSVFVERSPPMILATGVIGMILSGFVGFGGYLRLVETDDEHLVEAAPVILLAVGVGIVVSTVLTLRPWQPSLTQGFRIGLTAGGGAGGAILTMFGWRERTKRRYGPSLVLLGVLFVVSLSYLLFG